MKVCNEQSSDVSKEESAILQNAAAFWKWYELTKDTPRETHATAGLIGLYAEYQDTLSDRPIDLGRIERLTAEAALLLLGKRVY